MTSKNTVNEGRSASHQIFTLVEGIEAYREERGAKAITLCTGLAAFCCF